MMGLGADCTFAVADEPATWAQAGGRLMHEALEGSLGKPGSEEAVPSVVESRW